MYFKQQWNRLIRSFIVVLSSWMKIWSNDKYWHLPFCCLQIALIYKVPFFWFGTGNRVNQCKLWQSLQNYLAFFAYFAFYAPIFRSLSWPFEESNCVRKKIYVIGLWFRIWWRNLDQCSLVQVDNKLPNSLMPWKICFYVKWHFIPSIWVKTKSVEWAKDTKKLLLVKNRKPSKKSVTVNVLRSCCAVIGGQEGGKGGDLLGSQKTPPLPPAPPPRRLIICW